MTFPTGQTRQWTPAPGFCHVRRGPAPLSLAEWIAPRLPQGDFRRIVIKPNWVHHEVSSSFPIRALVTSSELVEAAIEACLARYPNAREISVGDVPLQSCNFERLVVQAGVDRLIRKYATRRQPVITFRDWRRERFALRNGYLTRSSGGDFGDPNGYREVALDAVSHLEPLSHGRARFGVADFEPDDLQSHQRAGHHRYLIAGTVLASDLVINLPKMKTHQKAGLTGALKNLVGCNGEKAYLAHYVRGRPVEGGDEFPPETPLSVRAQTRLREKLQKRSRWLFFLLRPGWQVLKRMRGIRTEGTRDNLRERFYQASGAWPGNDTIWRMVYDLNHLIRHAPADGGPLTDVPRRACVSILDGLVAGEGNGPLQPLPVEANVLVASDNPFLVDLAMCRLMGFDWRRIPLLAHHAEFGGDWGTFDPDTLAFNENDREFIGLRNLEPVRTFLPPPGWQGVTDGTAPQRMLLPPEEP